MPTCGVCNLQQSKYKCPECELPYCSVACNKAHKLVHEGSARTDSSIAGPSEVAGLPGPASKPESKSEHTTIEQADTLAHFDKHPAYIQLLQQYPSLRSYLRTIYDATVDPQQGGLEERDSSADRRWEQRQHRGKWSQEKADKTALAMLQSAKARDGEEGNAITAFVSAVNEVISGQKV